MSDTFRKRARHRILQPFREYQTGNIDRALNAFMNRLSLETKQRLFPREFLYKLINVNMTNNQKIAALGGLMNIKDNSKLYLPNSIRQKIFGKMTAYSNKITNEQNRRQYYQTKLNSASKNTRNTTFKNTATHAKDKIKYSILYGYSNDQLKILKENNRNINQNTINILKTGYLRMPELEELEKLLIRSKSNIEYYFIYRIKYSKNSDELKRIEKEFIIDRKKLFETLWNLILSIEDKILVLYGNNNSMNISHNNGLNWEQSIRKSIQDSLINEFHIYGHPDQSPDWHIFFFYLFDEVYVRTTFLENYRQYGVLHNNNFNIFDKNIPWKKYKSFLNTFSFRKDEFSKQNGNTIINIFRHYFKYLSTLSRSNHV